MNPRARTAFLFFLKLLVVGGIFYWLAQKKLVSWSAFEKGWMNRQAILLGAAAILLGNILGAIRWQILLRSQKLHLSHKRVLQLHLIGNFFNVALPGAVSGDFVKAFYVARELHGVRGQTFGTILFDRIVGLSALALVSVGAILLDFERFRESVVLRGIQTFVLIAGVSVVAFYAYLFFVKIGHDPVLKILMHLERKHEKLSSFVRIYHGIRFYHSRVTAVVVSLLLSIVIHLCAGFSIYSFLQALGDDFLKLSQVYAVTPLGFLITAVPLFPGGVGTGHAAFSYFLNLLGSKQGADAFSFYVVCQLAVGMIGGMIYLRFKSRDPQGTARLSQTSGDRESDPGTATLPS